MRNLLILLMLVAMPLAAANRGDVEFEHSATNPFLSKPFYESWEFNRQWDYAMASDAWPLIYKTVPYLDGPGHFLIPATNEIIFHSERTVSYWDGIPHIFSEPGKGYSDIFTDDAELGEVAPMRSGHFLVPERSNDRARSAKLIEFNVQGRVAEYRFPEVVENDRAIGAEHIELLADECTLLYGAGNRVARFNICTRQAESDFATLSAGESAGSIRQLPNGDVLVASGSAVLQFTTAGALLRSYPFLGVTHLALTPDGAAFWAGGVFADKAELRLYENGSARTITLGNPGMVDPSVPAAASDLVVVGEWRAGAVPVKTRGRAVR
jgi:hypothetical protein